ncbi:MAG: MBL fold metallo-hydrolase [Rhodobacteraceae bacterium]|nr:MBL fold metallo-hydrolase [Paracoccaceae bacterium]
MKNGIKVTILGCSSSGGVPRLGTDWGDCDPAEPKNARNRCSILVEKQGPDGLTSVVIDTGPDFRQQMLRANVQRLDAVLYTHSHADHLHGIDDLRMFYMINKAEIPVYMDTPTFARAQEAFGYCFKRPEGSSYPPILRRVPITASKEFAVEGPGGAIHFQPFEVEHGNIPALGFRFNDVCYLPDVSQIGANELPFVEDLDVWIIDCLRRRPHPTHFHLEMALDWIEKMKPKSAVLTNLHNDLDYQTLAAETADHIAPAYDGMTLEI